MFWKDDVNVLLSEQTNLYSVQRKGASLNTTSGEIEQFIGIQMYMSVIDFPAYRMYWALETRYPPIADVMSRNRYQQLREFLHVSDNLQQDNPENTGNKLYKIQPILEHVRSNCIEIEPEQEHSIDEQIIPAKTKYSGIRQYNPKKLRQVGVQELCQGWIFRHNVLLFFIHWQGERYKGNCLIRS